MDSPVEQVRQIRQILRQPYNNDETVRQIRELLTEPEVRTAREIEKDDRGWPIMRPAPHSHNYKEDPEA